jgi:hypothetical protein
MHRMEIVISHDRIPCYQVQNTRYEKCTHCSNINGVSELELRCQLTLNSFQTRVYVRLNSELARQATRQPVGYGHSAP